MRVDWAHPRVRRGLLWKSVANRRNGGIIKSEGVNGLEQAKKRDRKIFITEQAIQKAGFVQPSDFTVRQAEAMQQKHKELLEAAKTKNNSNEVLFIEDLHFTGEVQVLGSEFVVSPGKNPFAVSVLMNAERQSLIYLHNHPSTNTFSVGDIDTFVCESAIKTMSVVTNQGEVYVLNKLKHYSFENTRRLLTNIYNRFPEGEIEDKAFVKQFLAKCGEGGIEYAKSK